MADQTTTIPNGQLYVLSENEAAQSGFSHKFVLNADDVNDSTWTTDGDTVTVTLCDTPDEFVIDKAAAYIGTAFATDGTLTLQVGTDGDPDNFIDAQDAKTAGTIIGAAGAVPVTEAGSVGTASDTLVARFTTQAATGAPSDITAGQVTIMLGIRNMALISG